MRAKRTDFNQKQVVEGLRKFGMTIAVTSSLGSGFPDIVVGYKGKNWLFELKDPEKSPSQKKLTPHEEEFKASWRGQYNVVETIEDVLKIIK